MVLVAQAALVAAGADLRLIKSIRSKDVAAVRALIKQRVDVNAPQGDGATALHWAAHVDDLAIADLLIRAGAKATVANENGFTPLHLACTNRNAAMVERLLSAGADANAASLNGETVLMTCARSGGAQAVKALLVKGARVNVKEKAHDQTALMWAAAQRHPEVTELLIEAGAEINATSRTYAQTVVGEQTQRFGREELNYTVLRGGSTPLLFTARSGDTASARLLLAAGANVNDALPDGTSALVLAAHSGHGETAAMLLEKGANPNSAGNGYTALHAAVLRSDLGLVESLLAHKANPDVRTTKGTPLRRDTTDFSLPATLIGSTPYLLAARFLEPAIMKALAARRRRSDVDDEGRHDGVDAGHRNQFRQQRDAPRDCRHRRRRRGARKRGAGKCCGGARAGCGRECLESGRRHGAAHSSDTRAEHGGATPGRQRGAVECEEQARADAAGRADARQHSVPSPRGGDYGCRNRR